MLNATQAIDRVLIDEETLQKRVARLAQDISRDYPNLQKPLVLVCILKGSFIFCADLIRQLSTTTQIHFMSVSSYGDAAESTGVVEIKKDLDISIEGRDVLIVEDIADTCLTLDYLTRILWDRGPRSLSVCTLLDKPEAHKCDIEIKYVGFPISNEFVVGYGLDYAQQFRGLPYIGVLKPEVYQD